MRTFTIVWLGQLISMMGTGLTSFALGASIYESSGSVARFALAIFFGSLPTVLLSPLAGVLSDRWDRRKLWTLQTWYFYGPLFLGSAFSTLCFPAWRATVPLRVPQRHLGRAVGLTELSTALARPRASHAHQRRAGRNAPRHVRERRVMTPSRRWRPPLPPTPREHTP